MKIRSVLLGSVAVAGLSTAGFAADLGVVTSLDVCDALGLSGLTISSDDNCLQITGEVKFEYDWGNYQTNAVTPAGAPIYGPDAFSRVAGGQAITIPAPFSGQDSKVDIDVWLKFLAESDSAFGPAKAVIKLVGNNLTAAATGQSFFIKEAYVSVGDTTVVSAGLQSSLFIASDDTPYNYLGLFNSDNVNTGVGMRAGPTTGGVSMQVLSNLGNGVSIGGSLENLNTSGVGLPTATAVGVLAYAGDGLTAHVSTAINQVGVWGLHAGFTGTFDAFKVTAAIAGDSSNFWNYLVSAQAALDMFTLSGSLEGTNQGEIGGGASIGATVTDGVAINVGGRFWSSPGAGAPFVTQVEAGISAAITETITASGAIGMYQGNFNDFYGVAGLTWNPGGGAVFSGKGEVHTTGGFKVKITGDKTIK